MEDNIKKANTSMCSNSDTSYYESGYGDGALNKAEGEINNLDSISEELSSYGYKYMQCLGSGAFGVVVLARDMNISSHPLVALKLLPRGKFVEDHRLYVAREILHQGSLMHPFVIKFYSVFLTPKHIAVSMEYAAGGDLFKYLRSQGNRITEKLARYFFQQLILGLQYVHGRGVANRDLKLENLLLSCTPSSNPDAPAAILKISDFGYSKHEYNSSARTGVGTPLYMSPEIILGGNRYDPKKADIWSAGIILYSLLSGRYPFNTKAPDYAQRVLEGRYSQLSPSLGLTETASELVSLLLRANPEERPSLEEIMAHTWFQQDLPHEAARMNELYFALSPNPQQPPLSEALTKVEILISKAIESDTREQISITFPAGEELQ